MLVSMIKILPSGMMPTCRILWCLTLTIHRTATNSMMVQVMLDSGLSRALAPLDGSRRSVVASQSLPCHIAVVCPQRGLVGSPAVLLRKHYNTKVAAPKHPLESQASLQLRWQLAPQGLHFMRWHPACSGSSEAARSLQCAQARARRSPARLGPGEG